MLITYNIKAKYNMYKSECELILKEGEKWEFEVHYIYLCTALCEIQWITKHKFLFHAVQGSAIFIQASDTTWTALCC